ncbi:phage/plasmid primase, P4 family [Paenibacillus alkalitolerans]|uniref:phage/plasmid primase, P4 family n=1 Tax=Paenibacillus alkalitolerans TaxID=2799335 RepID=UPI0018F42391|nr:phage/plasmid primase, P4 family [Paenibacillus alkalitolerans]
MDHNLTGAQGPALLSGFEDSFIKLREDKAPIGWDTFSRAELRNWPNVGLVIPTPYVAVDIDDAEQAAKLMLLVAEQGIKCQVMQTTRGLHFWFAVAEPVKNSVKSTTGIGLVADYRSWGKQSQVAVKFQGEWREWLTDYDWNELDELPRWLRPLRQTKWRFYEMGEGDGRNQALYEYQIELAKRDYTQQEAAQVIRLINQYILKEPLPDREIATICREEAYPEVTESAPGKRVDIDMPWFTEKGKFLHHVLGDYLIREMALISYHQRLYVYKDGCYRLADNTVLQKIIELHPESIKREREEVMDYIRIQQHVDHPDMDEYTINLKNGRLNLKTMELLPHTPEAIDFQQVNAKYDPTAYFEPLDAMLWKVFCGDYQLYKLFEEIMGYCLVKNCRRQKIFIFFGEGSNGKSTVLRMIRHFIGSGNYSTLSLQDLETTFRPAELENKLVNVGDDIPATQIKDSSMLKKLSRGEPVTVERKNKNPFDLINYAKLIFSTNKIPPVADKSHGFYRTLTLLPFDAVFSKTDPDFNPNIEDDMKSEQAMSYLLNMAIRGYRRLSKKGFTESDKVEKALETYRIESSHALKWVIENEIDETYLLSKHTGELYYEFKVWCEQEGIDHIPKQQSFTLDVKKKFGLEVSEQRREQGTGKKCRYFVKVSGTAGQRDK